MKRYWLTTLPIIFGLVALLSGCVVDPYHHHGYTNGYGRGYGYGQQGYSGRGYNRYGNVGGYNNYGYNRGYNGYGGNGGWQRRRGDDDD